MPGPAAHHVPVAHAPFVDEGRATYFHVELALGNRGDPLALYDARRGDDLCAVTDHRHGLLTLKEVTGDPHEVRIVA